MGELCVNCQYYNEDPPEKEGCILEKGSCAYVPRPQNAPENCRNCKYWDTGPAMTSRRSAYEGLCIEEVRNAYPICDDTPEALTVLKTQPHNTCAKFLGLHD